jgi:hypothetical protein
MAKILNSQKTQNLLYSSTYNQTLPCGQQLSGCSGLFFGTDSLPLALILPLYFFKDLLERLKAHYRFMTYNMLLRPVVEVMRKGVNRTVVGSVIPSLHQPTIAILPMMAIFRHLEPPLDFDHPFGHLDQVSIPQQHAIAVVQNLFELGIPYGPPHDLHITHQWAGAQKFIETTEIRFNHA